MVDGLSFNTSKPNTTKINHEFIYARKSTNSLEIVLEKSTKWMFDTPQQMHQVYTHSTLQLSSVQNRQIVCVWHSMRKAKNNHLHNVYVDWSFRMNRINFDCMVFCEDERKIAIGCKVNALPLEMCQSEFLFPHLQLKYCW